MKPEVVDNYYVQTGLVKQSVLEPNYYNRFHKYSLLVLTFFDSLEQYLHNRLVAVKLENIYKIENKRPRSRRTTYRQIPYDWKSLEDYGGHIGFNNTVIRNYDDTVTICGLLVGYFVRNSFVILLRKYVKETKKSSTIFIKSKKTLFL